MARLRHEDVDAPEAGRCVPLDARRRSSIADIPICAIM